MQGMARPATLNEDGLYFYGNDGKKVYILYNVHCMKYMYMYNRLVYTCA